jgi:hypothetical protein
MAQALGIVAKKIKKGGLRTSEKMIDDDRWLFSDIGGPLSNQ